ncbi:hypothetical protein E2F50_03555 [Rhizobium deserti]|uniref:Uncharacterized protein n=1 Tax=Rhizobium deserti TaxID=2547961 RepID=A0A4R5UMX9_9HYPH|nr:hypothetical protein [Rhizobium deserti]TDK39211.1 hypothetical protein E2F50_03555 [Rhizobium deserti]
MTPGEPNAFAVVKAVRRELAGALALGIALTSHRCLREKLRCAAVGNDGAAVALKLPPRTGWLVLEVHGAVRILPLDPKGIPAVSLDRLLLSRPDLADEISTALKGRAADRADRLLDPVYHVGAAMTRRQYRDLADWAPLIGAAASDAAATLCAVLEDSRPGLLARLRLGQHPIEALQLYWSTTHAMATMMILGVRGGSIPSLQDAAPRLPWSNRTPSIAFTRERTLWMSAAGAVAAIASGIQVVDVYLSALSSAAGPLAAFDALFGLASVAIARPDESRRIATEIELLMGIHLKQFATGEPTVTASYHSALGAIRKVQARAFEARPLRPRLASRRSFFLDPAALSTTGRMNGFIALPHIVAGAPELLYPSYSMLPQRRFFSRGSVQRVLSNRWSEEQSER